MTHAEAVERLHDALLGRLDDEDERELAEHLSGCEECRAMRRTLRTVVHAIEHDSHARPEQIVALALHPERLEPDERVHVEAHLETCESCREELERVREVEIRTR